MSFLRDNLLLFFLMKILPFGLKMIFTAPLLGLPKFIYYILKFIYYILTNYILTNKMENIYIRVIVREKLPVHPLATFLN